MNCKRMYYFSYGSNLLSSRITSRLGEVRKVRNYSLPGYGLVFNCGFSAAYANIIPKDEEFFYKAV